ncbi:MAG: glycosyltransferase [Candidatus Omnitrophota bacterium]
MLISIVIPAYNEAKRLSAFLERVVAYCKKSSDKYEIIIVNDGSSDGTLKIAESWKSVFPELFTLRIRRNRGKGYAVKRGLLKAQGDIAVFLDADGSVDPEEINKNLRSITEEGFDIFIGSRILSNAERVLKAKWYRKIIGKVFNFFVQFFLFKNIKDTQCGFKMFKKEVIKPLFSRSYLRGFGFDVEILFLAHKMGYRVKEGAVSWTHVDGSKVNLLFDSIAMFVNILQIRNWHCTPVNTQNSNLGPDEFKFMYELEKEHWWYTSRRKLVKRLIDLLNLPSPRILDIGTGTGFNLLHLGTISKIFGIDISWQAIEFCKRRGLTSLAQCAAERMSFADKTFDVVTCLDLLEHVSNPVEVLLEVKRVLKDDGKVIITVPAFKTLWSRHDEALCHLRRYKRDSLTGDLEEAGLKPEKMNYFLFVSFLAVTPARILRKILVPKKRPVSDTTTLPPAFLNYFLKVIFNLETKITDRVSVPLGTTLYAVASKIDN